MPLLPLLLLLSIAAALPAAAQEIRIERDGSRTLVHETLVPAAPAAVWEAIATAEGWRGWAAPLAWTAPEDPDLLETSYDRAASPGDAGNIQQRMIARLPGRLLVFRTVRTPAGFPHAQAYRGVTSFFELSPEGAGTRVRLTGVNYPAGAEGDALLGFFVEGNRIALDQLRTRFLTGPIDWNKPR
ncbi:MAG: SRPBCC domain-containing protein [Sphingomonas sp.]